MTFGYSAGQLLRYYRWCKLHPDGRVVLPGGRAGWDEMSVCEWFCWLRDCLTTKITRGTETTGKGNRARRRAKVLADAKAKCKWCGTMTGSARKEFCCDSCAISYRF